MIRPTLDRIVIKGDPIENHTASGLYFVEDRALKRNIWGTVVAVGPGPRLKNGGHGPMPVKVGDRVWFTPHCVEVQIRGETLYIADPDDVYAAEEPEDDSPAALRGKEVEVEIVVDGQKVDDGKLVPCREESREVRPSGPRGGRR
jgi:co-chaperonin GroES (HSP10)